MVAESWASKMGAFDELIRQSQAQFASPRAQDGGMNARDMAAVRVNRAAGGPYSTAMPPQQQTQQPASPQSQLMAAIAAQAGEPAAGANIPVPTARPSDGDGDEAAQAGTGDAAVLEAMQGAKTSPIEQAIAAQLGDASVAEQMQGKQPAPTPPQQAAAPMAEAPVAAMVAGPQTQESEGVDPAKIALIVSLAGGTAGIGKLIQAYNMGDPDAARTFQAIGMSPDDLSMFAGGPTNNKSGGTYFNDEYNPNAPNSAPERDAPERATPSAKGDKPKAKAEGEVVPRNVKAKNLPNARPKVKVK